MAEGVDNESQLKCGICLSFYTEPRLLSCYHAFCTPCLQTLASSSNQSECPLCRKKIDLTEDGIQGLQLYIFTKSSGNTEDIGMIICDLCCDENRAIARCTECSVNLCFSCHEYHGKLKSSRNHKTDCLVVPELQKTAKEQKGLCNEHNKDLTVFCVPCNNLKLICIDCCDNAHCKHKTEMLETLMQKKRDILLAKNAILKARIPILENVLEQAKWEGNSYFKLCNQVKREIQSYGVGLKEVFCKAVDYSTQEKKQIIDNTRKANLKIIHTYQGEIETEILSLSQFTKTVDNIMKTSSDETSIKEVSKLENQLDLNLEKEEKSMPKINVIHFESGDFKENKIQNLLGKTNIKASTKVIEPSFQDFPLPCLPDSKTTPLKINGFETSEGLDVQGLAPGKNDTVWVLTEKSINLYSSLGTIQRTSNSPVNAKKIMKKSDDEIWVWCGDHAVKIDTDIKRYKVEFNDADAGCFIHTGNLIVYNPADKHLYDVSDSGYVHNVHTSEMLQQMLEYDNIEMAEIKTSNLVISQGYTKVFIVDKKGNIINIFEDLGAEFKAVTTDNYGNILVADYQSDYIKIFGDGILNRAMLKKEIDGDVYGVKHMTIDGCGNLWFSNNYSKIVVYSYI